MEGKGTDYNKAACCKYGRWPGKACVTLVMAAVLMLGATSVCWAQDPGAASQGAASIYVPDISKILPAAKDAKGLSSALQILLVLTVLSLAPSILIMMTCFTRVIVVLALLRQALATQGLPPNQVLIGLALFITFLVMAPTWGAIQHDAIDPFLNDQIDQKQALAAAMSPLRAFMIKQIQVMDNQQDVYMFLARSGAAEAKQWADVPTSVLIPSFITSELKTAFIIGFRIFLPFLVVDMVISSVLISMGMLMLPPMLISLPFKLMLFVLVDGWHLVIGNLLNSFM